MNAEQTQQHQDSAQSRTDGQTGGQSSAQKEGPVTFETLTNEQKAAIVLQVLGPESAQEIVSRFDEQDFRVFARGMLGIQGVSQNIVNAVIKDFVLKIGGGDGITGGSGALREHLQAYLSEDVVERLMEDVNGPAGRTVWERLSNCPDEAIAGYLLLEQPQTAALVLSKLTPEKAAKVLAHIELEQAKKIVLRMSRVTHVDPKALETVKDSVGRDFLNSANRRQSARRPENVIGSIMNNLSMNMNDELLAAIRDKDEKLAEGVQNAMFTFPDIATRVETGDLQLLVKAADSDALALALKLAKEKTPKVADYFFSNLSKRALEQLEEQIESLGPVRAKDAEEAQQRIVRTAQELAAVGKIIIAENKTTDDEQMI